MVVQVSTPLWKHMQGGKNLSLYLSMVHSREPLFAEDAFCRNLSRKSPQFFSTCCMYSMAETNTYVSLASVPVSQQNGQLQDSPNSNACPICWKSPPSKTNTHYRTKPSWPKHLHNKTKHFAQAVSWNTSSLSNQQNMLANGERRVNIAPQNH